MANNNDSISGTSLNLIVIRSADINKSRAFYELLGIKFQREQHGSGPKHFAADIDGMIFELYPQTNDSGAFDSVRLGFVIHALAATVSQLEQFGSKIILWPKDTEFGKRAIVKDPDGRRIELTQSS